MDETISYSLPVSQLVKPENIEDLTCYICLGICFRPIILKCCEHLLCMNCAKQFLLKKNFCPYCKETKLDFSLPSKLVSRFFDNLIFYCPNKKKGCNEQVRYSVYFEHATNCEKSDSQSIYDKLGFCKKCFILYPKGKETHICNKDPLAYIEDNIFYNKVIDLEIKQTNVEEVTVNKEGNSFPELLSSKE